jgi:hypothetical protein
VGFSFAAGLSHARSGIVNIRFFNFSLGLPTGEASNDWLPMTSACLAPSKHFYTVLIAAGLAFTLF